jgi:predicted CXXCH cytochrome family protein
VEKELLVLKPLASLLAIAALVPPAAAQISACAPCHAAIAANFQKTGMGRSFSQMRPETFPAQPYYHEASDAYYSMIERGGRVFQRRWQKGFDGQEDNVEEKQVDYVLGSGNHARTYLHLTPRGTLQQLPLGWYAENGGSWAMNPGYDRPDHPGSTRAISYECMSCHNAYPKIPAANREEGAEPKYLGPFPEGIDCQRCHGPGREHIATSGKAPIVNPARLTAERSLEVCMQCHLETTSRLLPHSIPKHGRAPFSYVPGQPLADFFLAFDRPSGQNQDVEVAGGAYRFRMSKCFLKSEGKLQCTSCHNPHDVPHGEEALAHYNQVCAGCHRDSHRASENCVGCHMPKTRTDDAVHIVVTDHRIQRGPAAADLTAGKAEKHETPATSYRGPVVPYFPAHTEPLYDAVAQIRDGSNLAAGLPRLAALIEKTPTVQAGYYVDAGEGFRAAGDLPTAIRSFETALARNPESLTILLKLGNAYSDSQQWAKAETTLRRATVKAPSDPLAWGLLGWALWQQQKPAEGKAALEKALKLDPDAADLHNYLGLLLMGTGDQAGALREFRAGVRLEPGIAEWRSNLGGQLAAMQQIPEARYQFEEGLRFKPQDAPGRVGYARLLAAIGDTAGAEKQVKLALDNDSKFAGGHELYGALRANRGDTDGALQELEMAVQLDPGLAKAQFELGAMLYSKGNVNAGLEHLRIAAKGGEAAAVDYLKRIGK